MMGRIRSARTRAASGRFLWVALLLGGCQLAGVEAPGPPGSGGADPIVSPGTISAGDESAAAGEYASARASFEARRYLEVLRGTEDIVARYPASRVSGAAVLLGARAELALGAAERADAAAERYIGLLREGDPRATEARFLQVEALEGQPLIQLDRLLRIDASASAADVARAVEMVRVRVDSLPVEELEIVADYVPRGGVASWPLYARLATELLARGDEERAMELASAAIEAGAVGEDRTLAEGVLRGELPEDLRPQRAFTIATVLPLGGPPGLAEYAGLIAEGVEVAVATVLDDGYDVTVLSLDDEADPLVDAEVAARLEADGVVGAVGFLLDDGLVSAGLARTSGIPIVSPTARSAEQAGEAVYSLEGADPGAAQEVALYSVGRAHQRVAMIYPDTPGAAEEADAFEVVADRFGIPIVGRYTYPAGTTDFEDQFKQARDALRAAEVAALGLTEADSLVRVADLVEPVGLFMPIPAEDVEFLAPQFAHYGLDTLAIEVLGTSGWTDPQALEQVDPRLMSGTVATAAVSSGPGSAGYARFQQAYEAYYQRSLVSATPQVGYDAALLLLEALRPGRVRPADVERSFERLENVEGATGIFSWAGDRILRRTEVVRMEDGELVPMPRPQLAPPDPGRVPGAQERGRVPAGR